MSEDWSFFLRPQWILAAENFRRSGKEKNLRIGSTTIQIATENHSFYASSVVNEVYGITIFSAGTAESFVEKLISFIDTLREKESIENLEDILPELDSFFDEYLP